jgi:hypothetical protein
MSGAPQARQGAARFIVCADLHLCVGKLSARVRQRGAQAAVLFLEHELVELLTAIHGTKRPKTAGVEDAPLPLRVFARVDGVGARKKPVGLHTLCLHEQTRKKLFLTLHYK